MVSSEESDKFIQAAIDELDSNQSNSKLAENVSKVAEWAVQIDEGFSSVTYGLKNLHDKHGTDFPRLGDFLNEWRGYNQRWTTHLLLSRDVASKHVTMLRRFDQIFLDMIQQIKTNEDREAVIDQLEQFINEDHKESGDMAKGFTVLKTDIQQYVAKFDAWIKETGTELKEQAHDLKQKIDELTSGIEALDKEIAAATAALLASAAAVGTLVGVIGLVVAGTTLAILIAQRIDKAGQLSERRKDLAEVNRKQQALAQIKTQFDGLKPDITMICSKLALFGEIWSAVQAQTQQFQETLKGGMEAVSNMRFKKEVQFARKLSVPLRDGLEKYASQLANRK